MGLAINESTMGWALEQTTLWRNDFESDAEKIGKKIVAEVVYILTPPLALIESAFRTALSWITTGISYLIPEGEKETFREGVIQPFYFSGIESAFVSLVSLVCSVQNLYVETIDLSDVLRQHLPCFAPTRA